MKKNKKIKIFSASILIATTTMVVGVKAFEYPNILLETETTPEILVDSNLPIEELNENTSIEENPVEIIEDIIPKEEVIESIEDIVQEEHIEDVISEEETKEIINPDELTLVENPINESNVGLTQTNLLTTFSSLSSEFSLQTHKPIDFGTHKIEKKKKIVTTGFEGDFTVTDARGTQDGWELKVSATPFTIVEPSTGWVEYNPYSLPVGSLTLSSISNIYGFNYQSPETLIGPTSTEVNSESSTPSGLTLVDASENVMPSINIINSAIDMGEFVTVATAGAGQGMGEYILQYDMNALNLIIDPVTAKVDKTNYPEGVTPYESTITWNLISGPSSGIVPSSISPSLLEMQNSFITEDEEILNDNTNKADESIVDLNSETSNLDEIIVEELPETIIDEEKVPSEESVLIPDAIEEDKLINDSENSSNNDLIDNKEESIPEPETAIIEDVKTKEEEVLVEPKS